MDIEIFDANLTRLVEIAEKRGFEPRLVLLRDKRAFQKGWPDLSISATEAVAHVRKSPKRHAVGIQPASLGCVVFDCDEGDGPDVGAAILKEVHDEVVACVTPSTSSAEHTGHIWTRCTDAFSVRNWKFKLEDFLEGQAAGDLRSTGQVRLNDASLSMIVEHVLGDAAEKAMSSADFAAYRTSAVEEIDTDFNTATGRELAEDEFKTLQSRLEGPDAGPRFEHFFSLVGDLKQAGISFDATNAVLSEYAPNWMGDDGDDGKFANGNLQRHLASAWTKLPKYISPEEDFDDLPDVLEIEYLPNKPDNEGLASRRGKGLKLTGKGDNVKADSRSFENALIAAENMPCLPRWNEFKQEVTLEGDLPWGKDYGRDFNDNVLRLTREFFMLQYSQWAYEPSRENVFEAVTTAAYKRKFHPVRRYLDSLTWDGTARMHRLFADGFGCDDDAFSEAVSQIFLVGAVARVFRPGCKVDTVPVIKGPQGTGKSSGLRDLVGDDWFSDAELGDLKSKDAAINLQGTWIQEIAELDKMSNADVGTMKAFISRATDKYRGPYDKKSSEHPRQTIFAATLNEDGYLRDDTGNRRYLPLQQVEGAEVDLMWIAENRDQLWAEAKAAFDRGDNWVLPREMWSVASDRQEAQTTLDPWEEDIAEFLRLRETEASDYDFKRGRWSEDHVHDDEYGLDPEVPGPADRIHSREIFEALGFANSKSNKFQAQRVRRLMGKFKQWKYQRSVRIGDSVAAGYVRR